VRLSVTDQGAGMDADTLARATEPFYTTKGVGKGTGLGLSMVHGLAEQSGGRLVLSSEPGHGTRVELWLPEARAVGQPRAASGHIGEEAATDPIVVLAVDDDDLVLLNTQAMLEDLGHAVVTAGSADQAMAALRDGRVDLVITDYAMPGMTGLQLAEAIHATRPQLPVVLATGYAELPDDAGAGLPRLAKPYTQSDLARVLRRVVPVGGRSAA
jgi:CheY-like chemotaxis protein